jgi:hypothetical protein
MSLWCLFYDPHLTTHQSNIVVKLRKVTEYHPHTLRGKKVFLLVNILHLEMKKIDIHSSLEHHYEESF